MFFPQTLLIIYFVMGYLYNIWNTLFVILLISFSITACNDSPSSTGTDSLPDYEYLFQWHTNGFIENNLRNKDNWRIDLLISNEVGDILGAYELFKESDGLLQFLPIDEFETSKVPENIFLSIVFYRQLASWQDEVQYQTHVTTYNDIKSGTVVGGQNSKDFSGPLNKDFNTDNEVNDLNFTSTETVNLELLGINNEFNDSHNISSYRTRASGGIYNGEIKRDIELYGKKDNALFVSVYSNTLDPNSDPRYWIVEEITDSISLNYMEEFGVLTEKVVLTPNGSDFISVGGSISVNGTSLVLPSKHNFGDRSEAYLLYPSDMDVTQTYYQYRIEGTELTHSKYYFGEVFSEIEDPMSVEFSVNEANTDSVSVNQSGDHDVFWIGFEEIYSNFRNTWYIIGAKGNDNFIMPKIDTHINSQHSNFYSKKLEFSQLVRLLDYDSFNKENFINHSLLVPEETNYRMLRMPLNND